MPKPPVSKFGRGTDAQPTNRFERLSVERDPELPPEEGVGPATAFLKDRSRSILTKNDSPDIPFEASLNPYRGCEHGCVYCLSGDTPILMGDGALKPLQDVRPGDQVYGTVRGDAGRRYVKTTVRDHWCVIKPAWRVVLEDGTALVAGEDHRFLTERGWKFVSGAHRPHLTEKNKLMGVGRFARPPVKDDDYRRGYLTGMIRGDGRPASGVRERPGRSHAYRPRPRLALAGFSALDATEETVDDLISWPERSRTGWVKGYLAGIFDAEGACAGGVWRVVNASSAVLQKTMSCLKSLGFDAVLEGGRSPGGPRAVRLLGGLPEQLRFFHTVDPVMAGKRDFAGQAVKTDDRLRVAGVEPVGTRLLYDITTGTGDFVADGVVSHNCYARPYHEYLGFSSGLDFETKIVVKEDAPRLLREELSSPRWRPKVIAMSGVTDCYQPVERRLKVTRGCLEVLAEFRNPVGVISKNFLVTRDIDILQEMARWDGAAAFLTVTTLDEGLSRILEPRASRPAHRLAAIEKLAKAGIPVGVMVAPVVPGITDHEMPRVLKAAANAGARSAGYTVMRLPYAVKDIFAGWLDKHFPDRKKKVLHRIEELRGGKLNDPRFGSRMRGEGIFAEQIKMLFEEGRRKAGFSGKRWDLSTAHFRRPGGRQLSLFEGEK